jgi:hypothetical protein
MQWIKRGERTGESTVTLLSGATVDQPDGSVLVALWFTRDAWPDQPAQIGVWRTKEGHGFAVSLPAIRATSWPPIYVEPTAASHAEKCAAAVRPT